MSKARRDLEIAYHQLDQAFSVDAVEKYGRLVVADGNADAPVHRWFRLKESFSADLLGEVLADLALTGSTGLALLDPYLGGATSAVSALQLTASGETKFKRVVGIERNPFLYLASAAKVRAFVEDAEDFEEALQRVRRARSDGELEPAPAPGLSTFSSIEFFPTRVLNDLLRLHSGIEAVTASPLSRDLLRLCLGGTVEPASNLRRDGRALRREGKKADPPTVMSEFVRRASAVIEDVAGLGLLTDVDAQVYLGDGRAVTSSLDRNHRFDLALFSPPYPNNIDYTEIYKLENWLLGLIRTQEEFRAQRLRTMRSHPSVRFADDYHSSDNGYRKSVAPLLAPLLRAVPDDRYQHQRRRLIRGYFDDILQTLIGVHHVVKPGGHAVYVVGNSAHGHGDDGFVIASDVLIASIAEAVGFEVSRVAVARHPSRRNLPSRFLRESVVFLKKSSMNGETESDGKTSLQASRTASEVSRSRTGRRSESHSR